MKKKIIIKYIISYISAKNDFNKKNKRLLLQKKTKFYLLLNFY